MALVNVGVLGVHQEDTMLRSGKEPYMKLTKPGMWMKILFWVS